MDDLATLRRERVARFGPNVVADGRDVGRAQGGVDWRAGSASMAVCVVAGDTTLTVTPCATTSAAQLRPSAITAALVAIAGT